MPSPEAGPHTHPPRSGLVLTPHEVWGLGLHFLSLSFHICLMGLPPPYFTGFL